MSSWCALAFVGEAFVPIYMFNFSVATVEHVWSLKFSLHIENHRFLAISILY